MRSHSRHCVRMFVRHRCPPRWRCRMAADRIRRYGPPTALPERLSGTDALLYHAERIGHPAHTLKIVVVDPSRLGRQVTTADVRDFVVQHAVDFPRLTQRVAGVRPFTGRPFWLAAPD